MESPNSTLELPTSHHNILVPKGTNDISIPRTSASLICSPYCHYPLSTQLLFNQVSLAYNRTWKPRECDLPAFSASQA